MPFPEEFTAERMGEVVSEIAGRQEYAALPFQKTSNTKNLKE